MKEMLIQLGPPISKITYGIEFTSIIILAILCFLIYTKTSSLEKLTSHHGIEFFRKAFLFFGITFILSFIILFERLIHFQFFDIRTIMLLILYFNLVAIGYLFFSLISNKVKNYELTIFLGALVVPLLGGLFKERIEFLAGIQVIISFIFLIILYKKYVQSKESKKSMLVLYFLLLVFWLLSGIGIYISKVLQIERELFPIIKVLLFAYIWYKIHKRFSQ